MIVGGAAFSGTSFSQPLNQNRQADIIHVMRKNSRTKKVIMTVIVIILLACMGAGGYLVYHQHQSGQKADAMMKEMDDFIPGLGEEDGVSSGMGRDPLAAFTIGGVDVVGCLEIPSLNLRAPVADKGIEEASLATWVSGSPVKGKFRLSGDRMDVFAKLSKAKPGDLVRFTDIDGVRYEYEVTTQYHMKDWDEGDNDLMLCHETTEDQTWFVLGCTARM